MARKRIYELLNQAVLTVSDYFMVDKSGNTEARRVSGQVLADFIHSTLATVAVSGDYDDLTNKPTLVDNFTELGDAPSSYVGQGGQFVKVNGAETALEFGVVDLSAYALNADLGAVAFSNDYNDLDNLPVITDTNVYNTNGTLTGNRTVTGGGFSLKFTGQSNFSVVSPSASALDTAFAVRNNTDTANLFQVLGDGSVVSRGKNNLSQNTSYGEGSLIAVTTGNFNTSYGYLSLNKVTTGLGNCAFGVNALLNLTSGSNNFAFGGNTLSNLISGADNVAIGAETLNLNATGNYNIAIGSQSLKTTTGRENVAIGSFAAFNMTTGYNNSLFGHGAGLSLTTGHTNCFIGYLSGTGVQGGQGNTIIGTDASQPSGLNNSVVIGRGAVATGDNQFVIGSSLANAGTIATEGFTQSLTWRVKINGVDYKIPLQLA